MLTSKAIHYHQFYLFPHNKSLCNGNAEDTEGSAPVTEQIDSLMLVASSKIDSTNSVRDSLDNLNLAEQNNKAHQSSITIESDTSWSPFTSEEWLFLLSSKASNMTTSELLDTLTLKKSLLLINT